MGMAWHSCRNPFHTGRISRESVGASEQGRESLGRGAWAVQLQCVWQAEDKDGGGRIRRNGMALRLDEAATLVAWRVRTWWRSRCG